MLEIDPATGTTRLIADELLLGLFIDCKYESIAAASNGRLYAAPSNASQVLEIDPATGTTRLIGDGLPGTHKYFTLVAASNGRLYWTNR